MADSGCQRRFIHVMPTGALTSDRLGICEPSPQKWCDSRRQTCIEAGHALSHHHHRSWLFLVKMQAHGPPLLPQRTLRP
eukprot:scaffold39603_cov33-Prasinocladus_malaysianus.AAC.1